MASSARMMPRTLPRTVPGLFSRPSLAIRSTRHCLIQPTLRTSRRAYSSSSYSSPSTQLPTKLILGATILAASGYGFYYYTTNNATISHNKQASATADKASPSTPTIFKPTREDYQKVYDEIARLLIEKDDYDDGSYGPVIVRLAWHCSGTYDAATGTGGSNGATMRFAPEGDHGANAGLKHARDFLEVVKEKFPWISYSDLWTLAGITALQEMQGPRIPWRPGRQDRDVAFCTPDGRLPDGAKGADHLRAIFGRMGFDDREIVALSGAHALGRCHPDRTGWDGPWDFSPTVMTNEYFRLLVEEQWGLKKWNGPEQYEDRGTQTLMMLPTDVALMRDEKFKTHVLRYAEDGEVFFREFADVFVKLVELGVPFTQGEEERWTFRTLEEGEEQ